MTPLPNEESPKPAADTGHTRKGQGIRWEAADVKTTYANVCNVTSTREEVVLDFGVYHPWQRKSGAGKVQLTNRVVLSPFAIKRLGLMLNTLTQEYESRYGKLELEVAASNEDSGRK
jgi:hypothetical protein